MTDKSISIHWFRRDLRLKDNASLYSALKSGNPVLCLFIFDTNILDDLEIKDDARIEFIHDTITELKAELRDSYKSDLLVKHGKPEEAWKEIIENYNINSVYTNRDYEPYAKDRDNRVHELLKKKDIEFNQYKDQVIFDKGEVLKSDGDPYVVYTPYKNKFYDKLLSNPGQIDSIEKSYYLKSYPSRKYGDAFLDIDSLPLLDLDEIGFERSEVEIPSKVVKRKLIKEYDKNRDIPVREGTSRLGIHFRFGTISIREKARRAIQLNKTYFDELVWRDFYAMILDHFPKVVDTSFREKYDQLNWRNNKEEFEAWCEGKTGFPIVDAGMRQLNETGYMHNRLRMITASFLTKDLLIDWRWGEAYFARYLLDYELASNNGGWQWAAGTGTDAAPYFRIFNPTTQLEKYDPELKFVKKFIPEYGTDNYPDPIVDHQKARKRCLKEYKKVV